MQRCTKEMASAVCRSVPRFVLSELTKPLVHLKVLKLQVGL
jgi:hypothetical protein